MIVGWAVVLVVAVLACIAPVPRRIAAPVLIEPADADRIYVTVPGRVVETRTAGDSVAAGDVIARLEDPALARELAKLRGERSRQAQHIDHLERRRVSDPAAAAELPAAKEMLADLDERLTRRTADLEKLTLRAPRAGVVLPPRERRQQPIRGELPSWSGDPLDPRNRGAFLETGSLLCLVGDPQAMRAMALVDQADVELVAPGQAVKIRLEQWPRDPLTGKVEHLARLDLREVPDDLAARQRLAVAADPGGQLRPSRVVYQARIALDPHQAALLHGATGNGRIIAPSSSIASRVRRWLNQTFRVEL